MLKRYFLKKAFTKIEAIQLVTPFQTKSFVEIPGRTLLSWAGLLGDQFATLLLYFEEELRDNDIRCSGDPPSQKVSLLLLALKERNPPVPITQLIDFLKEKINLLEHRAQL